MATGDRDLHQGGMQAFVDQEVHPTADAAALRRLARGSPLRATVRVLFIVRRACRDGRCQAYNRSP
jgi:hypothetical protein